MLNRTEIAQKHYAPIQAAILKHRSKLDEAMVSRLYRTVLGLLRNPNGPADQDTIQSRVVGENVVIITCTDKRSGLYVQLSGQLGVNPEDLTLVFGQKFCQEFRNPQDRTCITKVW